MNRKVFTRINPYTKAEELRIEMTVNGYKGNAKVKWFPERWDYGQQCTLQGEYKVFISVPFKDSRWESLFIFDENKRDVAIENACEHLDSALKRCGLCG